MLNAIISQTLTFATKCHQMPQRSHVCTVLTNSTVRDKNGFVDLPNLGELDHYGWYIVHVVCHMQACTRVSVQKFSVDFKTLKNLLQLILSNHDSFDIM